MYRKALFYTCHRYVRFRWVQDRSSDVSGWHKWSLRDVYIGPACLHHCLGRGSCLEGRCRCDPGYSGDHCQHVTIDNVVSSDDGILMTTNKNSDDTSLYLSFMNSGSRWENMVCKYRS